MACTYSVSASSYISDSVSSNSYISDVLQCVCQLLYQGWFDCVSASSYVSDFLQCGCQLFYYNIRDDWTVCLPVLYISDVCSYSVSVICYLYTGNCFDQRIQTVCMTS